MLYYLRLLLCHILGHMRRGPLGPSAVCFRCQELLPDETA